MNIFVLDEDPTLAAQAQCNKHVVKMIVETAQLLSTAHPSEKAPYKHTHLNHPCARRIRASAGNYRWLAEHGLALCREYTTRYGKVHKTQAALEWLASNAPPGGEAMTPFVVAVKRPVVGLSVVEAYRVYYVAEKRRFARWAPRAVAPSWWPFPDPDGALASST